MVRDGQNRGGVGEKGKASYVGRQNSIGMAITKKVLVKPLLHLLQTLNRRQYNNLVPHLRVNLIK
jgi:hypothetical protein